MRRTVASSAVLALALGGTLVGCGGGSGSTASPGTAKATISPIQVVQAAYTRTTKARSMRFSLSGTVDVAGEHMTLQGGGSEDVASGMAEMSMTVPQVGEVDMRVVGRTMYEKMPSTGVLAGSPVAGKWIKVDLSEMTGSTAGGSDSLDAKQMLGFLKNVSSGGLTQIGNETVRGVPTVRYAATVELGKVLGKAAAGSSSDGSSMDIGSLAKQMGLSSMPMQLSIDASGLVRRISMSMSMHAPAGAAGSDVPGSLSMSMDFYDFGTPVDVTAPPADQVVDGSGMLAGLGAGSQTPG